MSQLLSKGIRDHLLADATVHAIVDENIHYKGLPSQSTFPHIWFSLVGREKEETLDGTGLTYYRYSMELVSFGDSTFPDGRGEELADAVYDALNEVTDSLGDFAIDSAYIEDADDNYVFKSVDSDERLFLKAFDLLVIA